MFFTAEIISAFNIIMYSVMKDIYIQDFSIWTEELLLRNIYNISEFQILKYKYLRVNIRLPIDK